MMKQDSYNTRWDEIIWSSQGFLFNPRKVNITSKLLKLIRLGMNEDIDRIARSDSFTHSSSVDVQFGPSMTSWVNPYSSIWVDPYPFIIGEDQFHNWVRLDSRRHWQSTSILYVLLIIASSKWFLYLLNTLFSKVHIFRLLHKLLNPIRV